MSTSFSTALFNLKAGLKVARSGWNGHGMWVEMQQLGGDNVMSFPFAYINYPVSEKYPAGARCPWVPSQTDLFAEDWSTVP